MTGFFHRRIATPLRTLLHQGTTPRDLARSVAWGACLGIFPIYGLSTTLCIVTAAVLRLNQVAIQVANYLMTPLHIAMIVVCFRMGEWMLGAPHMSLAPSRLREALWTDPVGLLARTGRSLGAGIVIWAIVCIPLWHIIRAASQFVFDRWHSSHMASVSVERSDG